MKKKDVLNAISGKNVNNKKKGTVKKTNKKTTVSKKNRVNKEKKSVLIVDEIKEQVIEDSVEKKENIIEKPLEKKERTFKQKCVRFFSVVGVTILAFVFLFFIFATFMEYNPEEKEKIDVKGEVHRNLSVGDTLSVMTWNIGYAALGETADFYKEEGTMVFTADRNRLNSNIKGIRSKITDVNPNILLLQEIDFSASRSSHVNEVSSFRNYFSNYMTAFAMDYKVAYVPYPVPAVGDVNSGIMTFSQYQMDSAERIALPPSSIWPFRTLDMKPCLLLTRISLQNTDKQLVFINLHFDDYSNEKEFSKQTQVLLKTLKEEFKKGNYVVAGGDFGQIFSSKDTKKYPLQDHVWHPGKLNVDDFDDSWQFLMDENVPSKRSLDQPYKDSDHNTFQYYLVDGYIVSNNINVNTITTQDFGFAYSDHNPVLMNITLS